MAADFRSCFCCGFACRFVGRFAGRFSGEGTVGRLCSVYGGDSGRPPRSARTIVRDSATYPATGEAKKPGDSCQSYLFTVIVFTSEYHEANDQRHSDNYQNSQYESSLFRDHAASQLIEVLS